MIPAYNSNMKGMEIEAYKFGGYNKRLSVFPRGKSYLMTRGYEWWK